MKTWEIKSSITEKTYEAESKEEAAVKFLKDNGIDAYIDEEKDWMVVAKTAVPIDALTMTNDEGEFRTLGIHQEEPE
jgi:hypothetical protein